MKTNKKSVPFFAVGALIVIVLLFVVSGIVIKKYTPSKEREDLASYYELSSDEETAVILNNSVLETKGRMIGGIVYLDYETVRQHINNRFYWDANENKLLYTTARDLILANAESDSYNVNKESRSLGHTIVKADASTAYIAVDFLKLYSDFSYEVLAEPNRIVLHNDWSEYSAAPLRRHTQLRVRGGVKSPILADLEKRTEVTVLEPDQTWTKVATTDGIIGYVKSKTLGNTETKARESDFEAEEFTHIRKDFKINLGWHQVTTQEANTSVASVLHNSKGLNVISPTWFYLNDNNGSIMSFASSDYVKYCHSQGVEVWALVSNLENPDVSTKEVLSYTSRRETLINNLISSAIQYNLDGINVDFEMLSAETGDDYIQFIRELSLKCANNNIVLSVDNYVPMNYNAFYNRAEQALFADYVIIMAYDEHYNNSEEAGSVASIGFVRDGAANTLKEVPAEQIILGMPFYTRVWSETPASDGSVKLSSYAAGMADVQKLLSANGVEPVWSEADGQHYAEYQKDGVTYRIWIENAVSLEEKLKVMQANHFAGGSFWKLGLETPDVWDTILKYIN